MEIVGLLAAENIESISQAMVVTCLSSAFLVCPFSERFYERCYELMIAWHGWDSF